MTPVGVFFICQNEDKCHFVNSTKLGRISARVEGLHCASGQRGVPQYSKSLRQQAFGVSSP